MTSVSNVQSQSGLLSIVGTEPVSVMYFGLKVQVSLNMILGMNFMLITNHENAKNAACHIHTSEILSIFWNDLFETLKSELQSKCDSRPAMWFSDTSVGREPLNETTILSTGDINMDFRQEEWCLGMTSDAWACLNRSRTGHKCKG